MSPALLARLQRLQRRTRTDVMTDNILLRGEQARGKRLHARLYAVTDYHRAAELQRRYGGWYTR